MKKQIPVGPVLICIAAFLAVLFGGQLSLGKSELAPGFFNLMSGAFGTDAPLLGHALIGVLVLFTVAFEFARRKVVQVPNAATTSLLVGFFTVLACSTSYSNFKSYSWIALTEWLTYGAAFFATIATLGRRRGPLAIASTVLAACAIVGLLGIREYAINRFSDPTWRIFAGWVNPNATAAILLVGFFVGIGISEVKERLAAIMVPLGAGVILFAMTLTGSKGALLLSLPIGLTLFGVTQIQSKAKPFQLIGTALVVVIGLITGVCFVKGLGWLPIGISLASTVALLVWTKETHCISSAKRLGASFVCCLAMIGLFAATAPKTAASAEVAAPFARVTNASSTQEQSSTFRLLLWKGAAKLGMDNPIGYGFGTYNFESARPGLTTQTVFAHNVYLQLWAESSILAPLLFFAFVGICGWNTIRSSTKVATHSAPLRAGIVAALAAILIHSLVDSDLYYFGIGLVFFVLLGTVLLLSTDAVAPEFIPVPMRSSITVFVGLLGLVFLFFGHIDAEKSQARFLVNSGSQEAISAIDNLTGTAPFDDEPWHLKALVSRGPEQLAAATEAASRAPSTVNLRHLAKLQSESGPFFKAVNTYKEALTRNPNNLDTLEALTKLYIANGETESALKIANRMIETEETPYFKVRSIDYDVPVKTFWARLYVAQNEKDPQKRISLLVPALSGFKEFSSKMAPVIVNNNKLFTKMTPPEPPTFRFSGIGLVEVHGVYKQGHEVAVLLSNAYRETGNLPAAGETTAEGDKFLALAAALVTDFPAVNFVK